MSTYRLEFITPLFSRGAYEDRPEIRSASVRGQLHWWFRALENSYADEKSVFGGVYGGATSSKIVIRVFQNGSTPDCADFPTLPHKQGAQASLKKAFPAGTACDLSIPHPAGRFGWPVKGCVRANARSVALTRHPWLARHARCGQLLLAALR